MHQRGNDKDEPQNINSNNIRYDNNQQKDSQIRNMPVQINNQSGSIDSTQIIKQMDRILSQCQKIINKIDSFNQLPIKTQQKYQEMQYLIGQYILAQLHPKAANQIGEFLLRNGKFIVAFVQIITRNEKKIYLKNYLFNYFNQLNNITYQRQFFDKSKEQNDAKFQLYQQNLFKNRTKVIKKTNQSLSSLSSSRNQANWSTKVQKDTNSPFKSSVFQSQNIKKSEQKLKRLDITTPYQVNQQSEKSGKLIRNTKVIIRKSRTKSKSISRATPSKRSKSKTKNKMPASSRKKQQDLKNKQTITKSNVKKSANKSKSKSKAKQKHQNQNQNSNSKSKVTLTTDQKLIYQNEKRMINNNNQEQVLGSCYHYEIKINPRNNHKQLIQLRTSARLSKSKSKSKRKSRSKSKNNNKRYNKTKNQQRQDQSSSQSQFSKQKNQKQDSISDLQKQYKQQTKQQSQGQKKGIKSNQKNSKQKGKRTSSRISHNKRQLNSRDSSSYHPTQESEQLDRQIQVDWVKNNLKQLNIHDIKLYSQFTALTKNDQKITQFLLEMENSQQASQMTSHDNQNNSQNEHQNQAKNNKKTRKRIYQKNNKNQKSVQQKLNQQQPQVHEQQNYSIQQHYVIQQLYQYENTQTRLVINKPIQKEESEKQLPKQLLKFEQIKKSYQISQFPITIDYVVDPNLNGHNIYAFLKLGRVTQLQMGTAYAISPLTGGAHAKKRHIKQDLQKAQLLAGEYKDNIGFIPMNEHILQLVNKKNQQLGYQCRK